MSVIEKDWVFSKYPHDFRPRDSKQMHKCGFTAGSAMDASVDYLCGSPKSAHRQPLPSRVQARDEPCADPENCDIHGRHENELPGMWESADFTGGQDEERPAPEHMGPDHNLFHCPHPDCVRDAAAAAAKKLPVRLADAAQYVREPIPVEQRGQIRVRLLNAMPDPYGSVAALCAQYKGEVVRSLEDVSDADRRAVIDDMLSTVLNGPLEVAQFHFQIEGVTRSITHQMVRSRASFFAQESLRFAVPEGDWAEEIPLPPYLSRTEGNQALGAESDGIEYARNLWDEHMRNSARTYAGLIDCGMPAEEARGVLPHDMPTRIHWVLDLRTLLTEAGKRTCTQAQFPWRMIFAGMAKALREYANRSGDLKGWTVGGPDSWQFEDIANRLRPVCFQTGSCGFMAKFDRNCSIRERVDANESIGRAPSDWGQEGLLGTPNRWARGHIFPWSKEVYDNCHPHTSSMGDRRFHIHEIIPAINDWEWAADPSAARS